MPTTHDDRSAPDSGASAEVQSQLKRRGRRPKANAPMGVTVQVRLTHAQREAYRVLGEYEWLRRVLDRTSNLSCAERERRLQLPLYARAEAALPALLDAELIEYRMPDRSLLAAGIDEGDLVLVRTTHRVRPNALVLIDTPEGRLLARLTIGTDASVSFCAEPREGELRYPYRKEDVKLVGEALHVVKPLS